MDQKDPSTSSSEPTISKSQLKKQLKRQKWLEKRPEKRRLEREKKKEKRKSQRDEKQAGCPANKPIRTTLMSDSTNKFRVVIDLDFEEFMTDNELSKACQQVARIYSINRHSENPCQLYVTSLKGSVRDKFLKTNTGCDKWDIHRSEQSYQELFDKEIKSTCDDNKQTISKLIYLSGDSENTLEPVCELLKDKNRIFVIGGLVDHNRHKNLCQRRAEECGVYTARLPIKEHVKLSQRHILSTVTVFDILLKVLASQQDWPEALAGAIPKRKLAQSVEEPSEKQDERVQ